MREAFDCRFAALRPGFLALLVLLTFSSLHADNGRPDEGDMFGGSPAAERAKPDGPARQAPAAKAAAGDKDAQELNASNPGRDAFASGENTDNPLQIGGIIYQQAILSPQEGQSAADAPFSLPLQVDTFLDARPNDRIRGYIDARLIYDSTKDSYARSTAGGRQLCQPAHSRVARRPQPQAPTTPRWSWTRPG